MTEPAAQLDLRIEMDSEVEPENLAELAVELRQQLKEQGVPAELATSGPAPAGARAGELLAVGALIVMLVRSPKLFELLIETVQTWISRRGARSVILELNGDKLEVYGISRKDQQALIQEWIKRNTSDEVE